MNNQLIFSTTDMEIQTLKTEKNHSAMPAMQTLDKIAIAMPHAVTISISGEPSVRFLGKVWRMLRNPASCKRPRVRTTSKYNMRLTKNINFCERQQCQQIQGTVKHEL